MKGNIAKSMSSIVLLLVVSLFPLLSVRSVLAEEPSTRVTDVAVPAKVLAGRSFTVVVSVEWSGLDRMSGENLPGGSKIPGIPPHVLQPPYRFEVSIYEKWAKKLWVKEESVSQYSGSKKYNAQLTAPTRGGPWQLTAFFGLVLSFEIGTTKFVNCTFGGGERVFNINVSDKATITVLVRPERSNLLVSMDGVSLNTDATGKIQHQLTVGQKYTIQVPSEISTGAGVRIIFVRWSNGQTSNTLTLVLTDDTTLTAEYKTQYLLTVNSPVGNPQGSGWYDQGTSALFSVTSPWPIEGLLGTLGGKYVFRSWSGDSTATASSASVAMDRPKTVTAEWSTDNTIPYIILGIIGAAVTVVAVLTLFRKRRRAPTPARV